MRMRASLIHTMLVAIASIAGMSACGPSEPRPAVANDPGPREKESRLADKVKDAFKDNIFLKPNRLEVVVLDEKDGFVKLSLAKGNRELREMLARGADLESTTSEMEASLKDPDLRQSWTALKKAVGYVKTIEGVKAVLVTGETNTIADRANDLYEEARQLIKNGDNVAAADKMRKAADMGYSSAQWYLGYLYKNGHGVPQDYKEAIKWYRLAADQGDAKAQYALGFMYIMDQAVPLDYMEGAKWHRLAADQGHTGAQYTLGKMYFNGHGVPQDYKEAIKWLRLAADQGDTRAQEGLGDMYYVGKGVSQDYKEAIKLYRIAADQGDASAQIRLAWLLATSSDPQFWNGREAVKYAEMATGKTREWYTLDTLAAAYARAGRYDKAIETANESLAMLYADANLPDKEKIIEEAKTRLESYLNNQPWTAKDN